MLSYLDRVQGVLFGTAFGDAIGATIEKLTYEQISNQYGRVETLSVPWHKSEWPASKRNNRQRGFGIVTDDTLMTIALMNIYNDVHRHLDSWDMADKMVKEIAFKKTYIPELDREDHIIERLFYPEKWIFQRHVLANCEPREGGIGNMINCGAAMYIAPIGVVNACNPKAAYDEAINFACGHQASYGLEAAGVLAACVAKAFEPDVTVESIVETAIYLAKDGTKKAIEAMCEKAQQLKDHKNDHALIVAEFQKTILQYSPMGDDVNRKLEKVGMPSNHYVPSRLFSIEELPFALAYSVLHEGDFRKTIIDGVNSGRDTDSIGVMAGAILGAMQGSRHITDDEKNLLSNKNKMQFDLLAEQFSYTARDIIANDLRLDQRKRNLIKNMME